MSEKNKDLEKIAYERIQKLENEYRNKKGGIPLWLTWLCAVWIDGYKYAKKNKK